MNYPNSLKNLIECFKKLPGIGEKTAERLAFSMIEFKKEDILLFSKSIIDIKEKIKKCTICNNLTEEDICSICNDKNRESDTICVVEDTKNVILFEKIGMFKGKYHILNGLISPLSGINPEDINIEALLKRISNEKIKEVIIAVKPTIEGETTALYILKLLEGLDIIVSKIAHGVPIGADMEYLDPMTLEMALLDRKRISE